MRHILTIIIVVLLASCATKRITTTVTLHDTLRVLQHDSTYIEKHDSIYIKLWQSGDTIFRQEFKEHVIYRDRLKTDTIYLHRTDTVVRNVSDSTPPHSTFSDIVRDIVFAILVLMLGFGLMILFWRR